MARRRRVRPGHSQRYGYGHRQHRRRWEPLVESGSCRCARCGQLIAAFEPWDLGHTADGRSYSGPEHRRCNRSTASHRQVVPLKVSRVC
jgi:hypothetical protein